MTPGPECPKGTGIEESTLLDSALGTIRTKFGLGKLKKKVKIEVQFWIYSVHNLREHPNKKVLWTAEQP